MYERAIAEGKLKVRCQLAPILGSFERGDPNMIESVKKNIEEFSRLRERLQGPLIYLVSVKGLLDGTINAASAAMFEPYVGYDNGWCGIPMWEQDELNKVVALYDAAGFQMMLHAIGDKAINMALNSYEYARKVNGYRDSRHRVEHVEIPLLSDLDRFRELGVIASTQAMFANPDASTLGNFAPLLGPERAQYVDSFSLFDNAGIVQVFGSDYPVYTCDILRGIEVAVTRMTEEGTPPGGWYPKGKIPVEAALRHYTKDAAYGNFQEHLRGTLEAGKFADFVVLSRDILEIPPTEISETEILLTVMGGNDTYRSEKF
jgi:hypothetical protein